VCVCVCVVVVVVVVEAAAAVAAFHFNHLWLNVYVLSVVQKCLTFLVLPFWYLLTRVVPDIFQKSSKTVVCVVCV